MSNPSYEVGFGRPPQHSRFKNGQSGNPKGRPKGSKNLQTLLREELDQKVQVTENGRPKLMSKRRIAVRQQVDKAVKGEHRAFAVLVKLDIDSGGPGSGQAAVGTSSASEIPPAAYDEVVSQFLQQLNDSTGGTDDGSAAAE